MGASRLCKAGFLHKFREIASALQARHLCDQPTFHATKQQAQDYQLAKQRFREHMRQSGFGDWVKRPAEVDNFAK